MYIFKVKINNKNFSDTWNKFKYISVDEVYLINFTILKLYNLKKSYFL
ncbi:hypothetical protein BN172_4710004 [Clostridioides difficile T15]|nr:hypothetical protein BN172_4710004 [Clostridioides difficile T15]